MDEDHKRVQEFLAGCHPFDLLQGDDLAGLVESVEILHVEGGGVVLEPGQAIQSLYLIRSGAVEVRVLDDGPGIAEELKAHVFDPFFTTQASGTGLGLAVARNVFAAHKGSLDFAESSPAGGCELLVRLPAASDDRVPAAPALAQAS